MWLIFMTAAAIVLACVSAYMRVNGFNLKTYVVYCFFILGFTGWLLPLGYSLAPSFYQAYMFAIGMLSFLGWLISALYFKEAITTLHYVGIVLILTGSVILGR